MSGIFGALIIVDRYSQLSGIIHSAKHEEIVDLTFQF